MLRAMAWKKPSTQLIETFDAVLPGPPAERRLMFGFPAAFVNGNMFMGLHEERLVLRLDDGPRQALLAGGAKLFEPMKGRPMKEYVVAPAELVGDRKALAKWADKAFAYGQSLPPKAKKPAKKPAAKKPAKRS
jgi:TfoX/Sxy family transcriptional regulator of competence genes